MSGNLEDRLETASILKNDSVISMAYCINISHTLFPSPAERFFARLCATPKELFMLMLPTGFLCVSINGNYSTCDLPILLSKLKNIRMTHKRNLIARSDFFSNLFKLQSAFGRPQK